MLCDRLPGLKGGEYNGNSKKGSCKKGNSKKSTCEEEEITRVLTSCMSCRKN